MTKCALFSYYLTIFLLQSKHLLLTFLPPETLLTATICLVLAPHTLP